MNEMIEEKEVDVQNIRPSKINEYIGQTEVKENMKIFIEAAKIWASRTWKNNNGLYNC